MTDARLEEIPLDSIIPDPDQPRNLPSLDELLKKKESGDPRAKAVWSKLLELASSILEVGLQHPITVHPAGEDSKYVIYDGQRRWMAMSLLHQHGQGNGKIACYVRPPKSDYDTLLGQLHTNIHRQGFNVFELARSLKVVHDELKANGGTVKLVRKDKSIETVELKPDEPDEVIWNAVATKLSVVPSRIYQIQAVLRLSPETQRIAEESNLPESKLRFVLSVPDAQIQRKIVKAMIKENLSNAEIKRRTDTLRAELNAASKVAMPKPVQIRSAIKPIRKVAREISAVRNVASAVNKQDRRTTAKYKDLLPEMRQTIRELEKAVRKLECLEAK